MTTYFNQYLSKQNFQPGIQVAPGKDVSIMVVIPCYNEPDIITSLASLWNCEHPQAGVEVICVVNAASDSPDTIKAQNKISYDSILEWSAHHESAQFRCFAILDQEMPPKFAGVGLARKTGMDEAISRFASMGREQGLICSFDADAVTDPDYFTAIENHFLNNRKSPGASIYFEHPVDPGKVSRMQTGIIQYETHLRYLNQCMRYTGFPYAFHTVGSSFVVRASAYVKQGGMNRFKAGEDFYFLHKIIPLGNFTEINTTRVLPSIRISDRVPFGTGASMTKWMENKDQALLTYHFESFLQLKNLFSNLPVIYQERGMNPEMVTSPVLRDFLSGIKFGDAIVMALQNSSNFETFTKRFYTSFDAFQFVKYLNFASNQGFEKQPVSREALKLLNALSIPDKNLSDFELLRIFRGLDKEMKSF